LPAKTACACRTHDRQAGNLNWGGTRTMGTNTMNSIVKSGTLLLAFVLATAMAMLSLPAAAQETELAPEHLSLAREYVKLTDKSGIYEVALVETAVETMQALISRNPEIAGPVDEAITKSLEVYKGRKSELMDQFARVYALNFTMDELQQIVAFYQSPVGTKLASANATLNGSLQTVMQVFEVNLKNEFFAAVRAELKAAGYDV